MSRIKDRISQLVSGQLPEFIRSDYTTFVTFLEAYYQFLEQDQGALEVVQNARSYADIDTTTEAFVQYFLQAYAKDIPSTILSDKRLLVKKINDLYAAKGSELSFQLLFRILYDKGVTVHHPFDYVLRPSDGVWEQRVSLRVQRTSGSVSDILNRALQFVRDGVVYTATINRVKNLTTDLYELFINANSTAPFNLDGEVSVSDGTNEIFTGLIKPTTTGYTIAAPGSGFKVGQLFTINTGGGVETIVKITKVTIGGGISALRFINYGYGFTEDFAISIDSNLTIGTRNQFYETRTTGYSETMSFLKLQSTSSATRYFDTDYLTPSDPTTYLGDIIRTVSTSTTFSETSETGSPLNSLAAISFTIGPVARYPGQYNSNKGFLSELDVKIEDSQLYQPFAYQLESEVDIAVFYDTVKKLIHPAGTNLFNNRTISNTVDFTANVSVISRQNVYIEAYSTFSVIDSLTTEQAKGFLDPTEDVASTDVFGYNLGRSFSDTLDALLDNTAVNLGKVVTDSVDLGITSDSKTITLQKTFSDDQTLAEAFVKQIGLAINNNDSTVSLTETATGFHNSYSDQTYFAEYYVGTDFTLI